MTQTSLPQIASFAHPPTPTHHLLYKFSAASIKKYLFTSTATLFTPRDNNMSSKAYISELTSTPG
jgi:hypothetical protein